MLHSFKVAITHRAVIAVINLLLLFLAGIVGLELTYLIPTMPDTIHEAEKLTEGLATLLIGYGVAVEERGLLMKLFGLYPAMESEQESAVDHVCHVHGFGYLVFGLIMEMGNQLIDLPNHIVNTDGIEHALMWCSVGIVALVAVLLVNHTIRMFAPSAETLAAAREH